MSCAENNENENQKSSAIETVTSIADDTDTDIETQTTTAKTASTICFELKCRGKEAVEQQQQQKVDIVSNVDDEETAPLSDHMKAPSNDNDDALEIGVVATAIFKSVISSNDNPGSFATVAEMDISVNTSNIASAAAPPLTLTELSSSQTQSGAKVEQTTGEMQTMRSPSAKIKKMYAPKPPIGSLPKPTTTKTTMCTSATADPHLPYISSDPTIGVQLRGSPHQQQKMKSYHDVKQSAVWDRDSIGGVGSSAIAASSRGTVSASGSPSCARTDAAGSLPRRVSFPKSDSELVTGYLEPANPWEHARMVKSISEIAELYVTSCQRHNTRPLQTILDHLRAVELNKQQRQPLLSLKSIKLASSDCEALEEIFKRVQYKYIDLSSCDLDESATSALFEMIEYYEAANELDISSNSKGLTHRGWNCCMYMVKHSEELQVLIASGNQISMQSAENLGAAMSSSRLHTLKLEHCGLKGALYKLCYNLRQNHALKELWLAHNDLDCKDAEAIANLLKVNHYLELLDISNNNIRDEGLLHIVEALILQSRELERRAAGPLLRSVAIDDDDSLSSMDVSQVAESDTSGSVSSNEKNTGVDDISYLAERLANCNYACATSTRDRDSACDQLQKENSECKSKRDETSSTEDAVVIAMTSNATAVSDETDADDDTDDTMKSNNLKNITNTTGGGQSMLDKLLSMNSESSSEDGASNLSTDTIAAGCSEDASTISDDILDMGGITPSVATVTTPTVDTHSSTQTKLLPHTQNVAGAERAVTEDILKGVSSKREAVGENLLGSSNMSSDILTFIDKEEIASHDNSCDRTDVKTGINSNSNDSGNNTLLESNNLNNNNNNSDTGHNSAAIGIEAQHVSSCNDQNNSSAQINALNCASRNANTLQNLNAFEVTSGDKDYVITAGHGNEGAVGSEESSILLQHPTKAVDVNKNTKIDDYDDTHSTDSAFESASEGDISRHLPEDFSRLSSSLDGTRIDDIVKGVAIETGTIVTESTEFLADVASTPTSTPTPPSPLLLHMPKPHQESAHCRNSSVKRPPTPMANILDSSKEAGVLIDLDEPTSESSTHEGGDNDDNTICSKVESTPPMLPPKVTIAEDSLPEKLKESASSPIPTPPPPSTSPGGASHGMRRTESSSVIITSATRNRSQSSDSLCSDNSLDGSISSDLNYPNSQLNEKLTKNDTLTRQQRQLDVPTESTSKSPGGLKALAVWNNNLTKQSGYYISDLLLETLSLELLNIGKNCLSNDFVSYIKESIMKNTTLATLGLQSAHLSANGIETLASILTFGGNSTLQRLDIRDNKLEVESLTKIAEVLKSNTTITQIDIDDEPKRLSVGSDAHLDYTRMLENVRSMCSRNKMASVGGGTARGRGGGFYMGSRKISLTCHTRPLIETTVVSNSSATSGNSKLDVKRKTGARLRSPVPSPPTISPSSSPNRNRFQVFRVNESTSPLAQVSHAASPSAASSASSQTASNSSLSAVSSNQQKLVVSTSLPSSSSLPSMATVTSSTESIKRAASPRSRFLVSKIYENPNIPLSKRLLPPITPPPYLPPTPIAKHADAKGFVPSFASMSAIVTTDQQKKDSEQKASGQSRGGAIETATTASDSITNDVSHTKKKNSTNATTATAATFTKESTAQTQTQSQSQQSEQSQMQASNSTLSPLCSSSSSSSSSTSPASLQSSSSSSMSCSLSTIFSTTSNSSSPTTDNTNSSETQPDEAMAPITTALRCPIAVFTDNDITLTKNSVCEFSPTVFNSGEQAKTTYAASVGDDASGAQQRVRKTSWIANPVGVEKLRALFYNRPIFQRSSSPETRTASSNASMNTNNNISVNTSANAPTIYLGDCSLSGSSLSPQQQLQLSTAVQQQPPPNQQNSMLQAQKNSTQPWTKLGTEILSGSTAGVNNATVTNAAAVTLEQSRNFLDAASRQLRDFGKQVFRQSQANNTSLMGGNLNVGAAIGNNPDSGVVGSDGDNGGSSGNISASVVPPEQHDASLIPTDVKQEIKENISPEHTINEETLHSLQKLSSVSSNLMLADASAVAVVALKSSVTEFGSQEEQDVAMSCVATHMDELRPELVKDFGTNTTSGDESPPSANAV